MVLLLLVTEDFVQNTHTQIVKLLYVSDIVVNCPWNENVTSVHSLYSCLYKPAAAKERLKAHAVNYRTNGEYTCHYVLH